MGDYVRDKRTELEAHNAEQGRNPEINADIQALRVAVLGEAAAANLSVEDGKRSPVELY